MNRFFANGLDFAPMFPSFHLLKLDLRHSFYPQSSPFPLSIFPTDWSLFFIFLSSLGMRELCVGGWRASWLIRILQRKKCWVVMRPGVWGVWLRNTGWHRPCRLQPKMHTSKILFTETSTKCADLGCVEGRISQNAQGSFCRCLCRCFWIHWTTAFLCWAWGHSKLYTVVYSASHSLK